MRTWWAVVIVAGGCGRIGFDATPRDDSGVDADIATGQFSTPTLVAALVTATDDEEPTFTADRLELVFRSGMNDDLFVSTRTSTTSPWGAPAPIAELNTLSAEVTPGIAADGLTLWFASNRPGGAGLHDIWVTTRPNRTSAWSAPVNVAEINTADDELARCETTRVCGGLVSKA